MGRVRPVNKHWVCVECGTKITVRESNKGTRVASTPYCEEHLFLAPHAAWVIGQQEKIAAEKKRVESGRKPDPSHPFSLDVLTSALTDHSTGMGSLMRIAKMAEVSVPTARRVLGAYGVRVQASSQELDGRSRALTPIEVDQIGAWTAVLDHVKVFVPEKPLVFTGIRGETMGLARRLRGSPPFGQKAAERVRTWKGVSPEKARRAGRDWICPGCGPVSRKPLFGDDNQLHCPNLECDEVVSSYLPIGSTDPDMSTYKRDDAEVLAPWSPEHNPQLKKTKTKVKKTMSEDQNADLSVEATIMTTNEIAAELGVSSSTLANWVKRGCPKRHRGTSKSNPSLYCLEDVVAWRTSSGKAPLKVKKYPRVERETPKKPATPRSEEKASPVLPDREDALEAFREAKRQGRRALGLGLKGLGSALSRIAETLGA